MTVPLKLDKLAIHSRIFYAFVAIVIICFAGVFLILPIVHIIGDLAVGTVPWPLIGFAFLSTLIGILLIWLASLYRVWILPYQFTIDRVRMICGYEWRDSWVQLNSLEGIQAFVCAPAWSEQSWPWVISAKFTDKCELKAIFNSHQQFGRELDSFQDCRRIGRLFSEYLAVPLEFDEWSDELIEELTRMGEQVGDGDAEEAV